MKSVIRGGHVLVLVALAVGRAQAASWDVPFEASARELLEATQGLPTEAGDGIATLLLETRWTLDADARSERRFRRIGRIVDQGGIDAWGSLGSSWEPWRQRRPLLRARVIQPDGSVRELDAATIDEAPAHDDLPDVLTSRRVVRAPLPNLAVGCVFETEIVLQDDAALLPGLLSGVIYPVEQTPVATSRAIIDAPATLALRVTPHRIPVPADRVATGDRVVTTWTWNAAPRHEFRLRYLPLSPTLAPQITVTTAASWGAVADAYAPIVDERARAAEVADLARRAAGDAKDARTAAARCLAAMHEKVRYTGLEFGEAAVVPVPPSTCLERGYGDCKDKATLLVAMLRSLGHRADVALLMPGRPYDVDREMPGLAGFTHAIVALGDPPLFIDATAPEAALGELPDMDRGHLALVARRGVTELIALPDFSPEVDRIVETVDVTMAEDGKGSIVERTESFGSFAVKSRAIAATETKDELVGMLSDYAQDAFLATAIEHAERSKAEDLSEPATLRFGVKEAGRVVTTYPDAVVALTRTTWLSLTSDLADPEEEPEDERPLSPSQRRYEQAEADRTDAFVLPKKFAWERRYVVTPPPGHELAAAPDLVAWTHGPCSFSGETTTDEKGVVRVTMRFTTGNGVVSVADRKALGKTLRGVLDGKLPLLSFRSTAANRFESGDERGGLVALRELVKLHPAEGLHHARLALALVDLGLGEAARVEARAAVAAQADAAISHLALGYALNHDLVGRRVGKTVDREGALAALRRAAEIEPKNLGVRRELADAIFRRSPDPWSTDGARAVAAEWRSMRADLGKDLDDGLSPLAAALFRAGDLDALIALSDESATDRSQAFDDLSLAAIAAKHGAQEALRRSVLPPFRARDRSGLLERAGGLLMLGRWYPEASALVAEAAQGSPDGATLGARADFLRKLKRRTGATFPPEDPRSVYEAFMSSCVRGDVDAMERLLDMPTEDAKKDAAEAVELVHSTLDRRRADSLMSVDCLMDTVLGMVDYSVEEDGADGARVRCHAGAIPGGGVDLFVRRKGAGWTCVGIGTVRQTLGAVALGHAQAGRLEACRRWLDWARESVEPGDGPLAPFAATWTQGQAGDLAQCKVAAAMLAASLDFDGSARRELELARETATGEARRRLDQAIALACVSAHDGEAAVRYARPLADAETSFGTGTMLLLLAWTELHRGDEALTFLRARAAAHPNDVQFGEALANHLADAGDAAGAYAAFSGLAARGALSAGGKNNMAWSGLLAGRPAADLLPLAQDAVAGRRGNGAGLHTLAAVLVDAGRVNESRQALLQRLALEADGEPAAHDWYVVGRIAEELGQVDAAHAAYARCAKDSDAKDLQNAGILAHRRLERLPAAVD